jgi:hypothetical protein
VRGTLSKPVTTCGKTSTKSPPLNRTLASFERDWFLLCHRELVEAYAHCADRRAVEGQMSLFTPDTEFLVYIDSRKA